MERHTMTHLKEEEIAKGKIISRMGMKNLIIELANSEQRQVPISLVYFQDAQASKHMMQAETRVVCHLQNDKMMKVRILLSGIGIEMSGVIKSSNKISTKISCNEQVLEIDTKFILNHHLFTSAEATGKLAKIIMLNNIVYHASIVDSNNDISFGAQYQIEDNVIIQQIPKINHSEEEQKSEIELEDGKNSQVSELKEELPNEICDMPKLNDIPKLDDEPQSNTLQGNLPPLSQGVSSFPPLQENPVTSHLPPINQEVSSFPPLQENPVTSHLPPINQEVLTQDNFDTIQKDIPKINSGEPPISVIHGNPDTPSNNLLKYPNNSKKIEDEISRPGRSQTDSLYNPDADIERANKLKSMSKLIQGIKRYMKGYMSRTIQISENRLRIPVKESFKNVPKNLANCYIDGLMNNESNQSLRLIYYISESVLRFRSQEMCDKLYLYLLNQNIEAEAFVYEIRAMIDTPIIPFEALKEHVLSHKGQLGKAFKIGEEATYQSLSDILDLKIDIYHSKDFKLKTKMPKRPEKDLLILHLLLDGKKLYGFYFPDHLNIDGIDYESNSANRAILSIPKKHPFYYISAESSNYISSINSLLTDLIYTNPGVVWQLMELGKMCSDKNTKSQISDILYSKFCPKCERETNLVEICRNLCKVCYTCMIQSVNDTTCLCQKFTDYEFILSNRGNIEIPCMMCGSVSNGNQACMLLCGCYLCKIDAVGCLKEYKQNQQAQCPYCFNPLSDLSFHFNEFLLND